MGLRRLIPRRVTATVVTGVLGVAGAAILAPAAHATPAEWTSQCRNQTLPDLPIEPTQTRIDISVEPVKPTYQVGEVITVHWKWLAYSTVPLNTPIVTQVDKDSTLPIGKLALSGADTREFEVEGERINPETRLGEELILSDMQGRLRLTKAGVIDMTPIQHSTYTRALGYDSETRCLPTTPVPVGATITVEPGTVVQPPVLNAPDGDVYTGSEIALTGSGFAPGASPRLALCRADANGCDRGKFWMNTLAIDAQGNLAGTAMMYPSGIDDGQYVVRVFDGTDEALDAISIKAFVHGDAKVTADRSSGPVGTVVHLEGTGWRANSDVSLIGIDAGGGGVGEFGGAYTTPGGTFALDYTITSPAIVTIQVTNNEQTVDVPFTVPAGDTLGQSVTGTINPGGLSMTQAGTGIDLGTITLNGEAQTMTGALNQVTVVDARAGNLGWQLTGAVTDLTSEGGTIPAGNVAWTPTCAAGEGSPSTVTAGTAGPITDGATLCSQAADATGATGGRFTADAEIALTTPAFVTPGTYTGTLTLTLT